MCVLNCVSTNEGRAENDKLNDENGNVTSYLKISRNTKDSKSDKLQRNTRNK